MKYKQMWWFLYDGHYTFFVYILLNTIFFLKLSSIACNFHKTKLVNFNSIISLNRPFVF